MINAKRLLKLAKKWQKLSAIKRNRITLPQTMQNTNTDSCSTSARAEKGSFVVYSADQKRFQLPLEYLNNPIIRELFDLAEEEYGLHSEQPLTLPCDAQLMKYAISLIKRQVTRDVEQALLTSIAITSCSSSFHFQDQATMFQTPICSF